MMRRYRTSDWVSLLPRAVELLNARPMSRNGGVPPADINSFMDDPILRAAREEQGVTFPEPNRQEEVNSEQQFDKAVASQNKPQLIVGSFVFLDRKQKVFDKSFELQVGKMFSNCYGFCVEPLSKLDVKPERHFSFKQKQTFSVLNKLG
mgnify:CR=1 FL=1